MSKMRLVFFLIVGKFRKAVSTVATALVDLKTELTNGRGDKLSTGSRV